MRKIGRNGFVALSLLLASWAWATNEMRLVPLSALPAAPWWTTNPTGTNLNLWDFLQTANTNTQSISNRLQAVDSTLGTLPDAQTNSLLSSTKITAYSTNLVYVAAGATNAVAWITNYAGASWTSNSGSPILLISVNGSNWVYGASVVTNTRVLVAVAAGAMYTSQNPVPVPHDAALTNLTIYALSRPDLLGKTYGLVGERVLVGPPQGPDDVTPRTYVDGLFATTPWWSAGNDVQINGFDLHFDGMWEVQSQTNGSLSTLAFGFGGNHVVEFQEPQPSYGNINLIWQTGTTNLSVLVTTNVGGSTIPSLQFTHSLQTLNWSWLPSLYNTWPMVTNAIATNSVYVDVPGGFPPWAFDHYTYATNWGYRIDFNMPTLDQGFVRVGFASTNPPALRVAGILSLPLRTITNSTDTTWGYGAGLCCWDATNAFFSVGTNLWKRAALSSW